MFGRATITLGIGPHSSLLGISVVRLMAIFITFRVSRRPREMYCGHTRLCVCLCVCPRPHAHTIARTRM